VLVGYHFFSRACSSSILQDGKILFFEGTSNFFGKGRVSPPLPVLPKVIFVLLPSRRLTVALSFDISSGCFLDAQATLRKRSSPPSLACASRSEARQLVMFDLCPSTVWLACLPLR